MMSYCIILQQTQCKYLDYLHIDMYTFSPNSVIAFVKLSLLNGFKILFLRE